MCLNYCELSMKKINEFVATGFEKMGKEWAKIELERERYQNTTEFKVLLMTSYTHDEKVEIWRINESNCINTKIAFAQNLKKIVDVSLHFEIDKQHNELKIQLSNLQDEGKTPTDFLINALFYKIKEFKKNGEFCKVAKLEKMIDTVRINNIFLISNV